MADVVFAASEAFSSRAHIKSMAQYQQLYAESINDPDGFWSRIAKEYVTWFTPFTKVRDCQFADAEIKWFVGGKLNICYNCVDRHLPQRANQVAFIWEGNEPGEDSTMTYAQLHEQVSKFANVLKAHGVKKGDRVALYMPMILELPIAMLACARIGAIHTVVFGGFSADSLRGRILDCQAGTVICSDEIVRGAKAIPVKTTVDLAIKGLDFVKTVIMKKRTGNVVPFEAGRDVWWDVAMASASATCPCEPMDSEDPLFILYTSGSTGKPKGVLHTTGGYNVYTAFTHKMVFDYQEGDIYWCTADCGWITGHSYIVYGPLTNGATTLVFEGIPTYPDAGRFWAVIDKWKVNTFYTAPTAIRALAQQGETWVAPYKLDSLRLLGTVGEPINPEAWMWYYDHVGRQRCPIVDTFWQTETGGIMITPLAGAIPQKPGSATLPFFGINAVMLDPQSGKEISGPGKGVLCFKGEWPGMMRGVYADAERFRNTYFIQYRGYYFTGDGCRRDEDGYYWITGRVDDVINVSGHRLGTAEIESALVLHPKVAEAAVVGMPHDIKGQGIYAFVTLNAGVEPDAALQKELIALVRKEIGPLATPDYIQFTIKGLPKTRSGKIMRRILRKIVEKTPEQIGDTSTLADPTVVTSLVQNALVK